mmetsp:Transcript_37203/g.93296  ORF Transcript_37203/g.93296 Transcript_37203/m.93296 type:complete len:234 (+) Transcript_37203:1324-2025(+)
MRMRSRRERQFSKYSKTTISHVCWLHNGELGRQRKVANGKTAWLSAARPGASTRNLSASWDSLKCSDCGLTHFTSLPACATIKTWFIPPPRMSLAPPTSARPKIANKPSAPKSRCRRGATWWSSALANWLGSPWIASTGQGACLGGAPAPVTGWQQEHGGLSSATWLKSRFTQNIPATAGGGEASGLAHGDPNKEAVAPQPGTCSLRSFMLGSSMAALWLARCPGWPAAQASS